MVGEIRLPCPSQNPYGFRTVRTEIERSDGGAYVACRVRRSVCWDDSALRIGVGSEPVFPRISRHGPDGRVTGTRQTSTRSLRGGPSPDDATDVRSNGHVAGDLATPGLGDPLSVPRSVSQRRVTTKGLLARRPGGGLRTPAAGGGISGRRRSVAPTPLPPMHAPQARARGHAHAPARRTAADGERFEAKVARRLRAPPRIAL